MARMESKSLNDLEIECTSLGIDSLTVSKRKGETMASGYGSARCVIGYGDSMESAVADLLTKWRTRYYEKA